jgi:cytochrome bd ubiquinol oxidase subunit II
VAVIWGWGVAQYPVLLPTTGVTLSNAGAPHATLVALVVVFVAAVLLIGPSFAFLFYLHGRQVLQADHGQAVPGNGPDKEDPPAGSRVPAGGS